MQGRKKVKGGLEGKGTYPTRGSYVKMPSGDVYRGEKFTTLRFDVGCGNHQCRSRGFPKGRPPWGKFQSDLIGSCRG